MLPILIVFGVLFCYGLHKKIENYKLKERYGVLMRKISEEDAKKYKN